MGEVLCQPNKPADKVIYRKIIMMGFTPFTSVEHFLSSLYFSLSSEPVVSLLWCGYVDNPITCDHYYYESFFPFLCDHSTHSVHLNVE